MKKYIMVLLVLAFYLVGCSDESIVSSDPVSNQNNYKLIEMPAANGLRTNSVYSVSKDISGNNGGSLNIYDSYSGGQFGMITKDITLTFSAGAFSGTKTISMSIDDLYCTASFLPGISFLKSVVVNVTYTGINLSGINASTLKFVYIKDDGTFEYLLYDSITVDYNTGKLSVKNVKINHFSRYGFVN